MQGIRKDSQFVSVVDRRDEKLDWRCDTVEEQVLEQVLWYQDEQDV